MKKFLCLAVAACLAAAPVVAFADNGDCDYDNGYECEEYENGYDYESAYEEYEAEEYEADEYEAEEYAEEYSYEAEEADEDDAEEAEAEEEAYAEVEAIAEVIEEQLAWALEFEEPYGTLAWEAPVAGSFVVTALVELENANLAVYLAGEAVDFEVVYGAVQLSFEANAGDVLEFVVEAYDEEYESSAKLEVSILLVAAEVEEEEVAEEAEEYAEYVAEEEYAAEEEYVAETVEEEYAVLEASRPIDSVATRYIDGQTFVAFRSVAAAYGYVSLSWNGDAGVVTVNADEPWSFNVEAVGGINDNGTVYVPFTFALESFEG